MSTSPSVVPDKPVIDDDDAYAWAGRQAALLRARRFDELDLDRIAGELDDVGSEIYERLESALTILFMHMLKWDLQPERRSRSWEATIREQRRRIAKLLRENPSLRAKLESAKEAGYGYGRDRASGETDIAIERFPEASPYSWQDIADRDFKIDPPRS
jgi:Domain of unknown function DUF29